MRLKPRRAWIAGGILPVVQGAFVAVAAYNTYTQVASTTPRCSAAQLSIGRAGAFEWDLRNAPFTRSFLRTVAAIQPYSSLYQNRILDPVCMQSICKDMGTP